MSLDDARSTAADARERLADALDQIEDRANIPKRLGALSRQATDAYGENPVPFIVGGAVAAAAAIGLIAWAVFGRD